jgi:DNA-binding Xre family transcriptional regulator
MKCIVMQYIRSMENTQIQERLERLSTVQIKSLAQKAGVSIRTLWMIRAGKTPNSTLETRSAISKHLRYFRARKEPT